VSTEDMLRSKSLLAMPPLPVEQTELFGVCPTHLRWGRSTAASRGLVIGLLCGFVLLSTTQIIIYSDTFRIKTQQLDDEQAPYFQALIGQIVGIILATVLLLCFEGCGGAFATIRDLATKNVCCLFFLVFARSLSWICRLGSGDLEGMTMHLSVMAFEPMLIPFLALCFERERDGSLRQYGLWPCLFGNTSMPAWGVFPGLIVLITAVVMSAADGPATSPQASSALGIAVSTFSEIALCIEMVTVSVLMTKQTRLHASLAAMWWACLICTPFMVMMCYPTYHANNALNYIQRQPGRAWTLYTVSAINDSLVTLLRYVLVHLASSLTTAVGGTVAVQIALITLDTLRVLHLWPAVKVAGVCLFPVGLLAHLWYMRERAGRLPPYTMLVDAAGNTLESGTRSVNESSSLIKT